MFRHTTVLKTEAVNGLSVKPEGVYVDCTMGGAGHSEMIARQLSEPGLLIGLDQDDEALSHAALLLKPWRDRVRIIKSNFRAIDDVVQELQLTDSGEDPCLDGVLYDLGVSSPQLDDADRGFSYKQDADLDMRMDQHNPLSAKTIVNEWSASELIRILFQYGEEKFSKRIARKIIEARSAEPIETTGQLAEIIKTAIPAAARRSGPHPAKRSFQAIRIAVNDELNAFSESLEKAIQLLNPGGRISVITFHSLEDRICKRTFAKFVGKCTCPPDFPVCVCQNQGILRLVNRKPIAVGEEELDQNPRARSAKLRIAEKL